MVEAPVPTMATRRPVRSCAWFHCAEWKVVPANDEAPGSSGMDGSDSPPPPLIKKSAVNEPREVSRRQTAAVGVPPGLLECGVEGDLVQDAELRGPSRCR